MDKEKLIYDLSLICVKQCLLDTEPHDMNAACESAVKSFDKAYQKISELIEPVFERINTL